MLFRSENHPLVQLWAPFLYTEIIMQVLLGYWLFGDIPDSWAFGGITLIIGVGLYLSLNPGKHRPG